MFDHVALSLGIFRIFLPCASRSLGRPRVSLRGGRLFGQFFVGRLTFENRDQPGEPGALFYFRACG
jgi:hypothetical protein